MDRILANFVPHKEVEKNVAKIESVLEDDKKVIIVGGFVRSAKYMVTSVTNDDPLTIDEYERVKDVGYHLTNVFFDEGYVFLMENEDNEH
ncbi:hypothetical protein ACFQL7_20175 [Halocatena marina]|uniref:Uncharacterized protein n=1 Tax=Halocatena marina TaxID=2934937 RepID=A0ABD5YRG2_9EURY|nr:hypothetical protein [Halocatena marina]